MRSDTVQMVAMVCPTCDTPLDRQKSIEVDARMRERDARKWEEQRRELAAEFQRDVERKRREIEEETNERANARIAETVKERDRALEKVAQIEESAEADRNEAIAQAMATWKVEQEVRFARQAAKATEQQEVLTRQIEDLQQAGETTSSKLAAAEAERVAALQRADEITRQAQSLRDEAVDAAIARTRTEQEDLIAAKVAQLNEVQHRHDSVFEELRVARESAREIEEKTVSRQNEAVAAEVAKVREALERDHERVLAERAAESARGNEALQKKITDLQRQVEHRTAHELGDGAELDLFEVLRDAFPDDRITRIAKGQPGADIKIEVLHRGEVAGSILLDSKNRKSWQMTFATKLRADQIAANADHAILSTTVFPSGKKHFATEADVILAHPGHVSDVTQILRSEIIKSHVLGLSIQHRAEKREALYALITSPQFRQKVDELARLGRELLELDVKEQNQHQRTWENRGRMVRQQQRALSAIEMEIAAIIEAGSEDDQC